ncbi:MGMT family protein [Candidatus Dojkabacteria bacterium]|uniref:MGMT family protein n=1 Tax=Candidatus Dojkabacteria bacterium TaxID=2099670 RepID=A0A955HYU1_9BACT|nr:MGMT family protein [Candidatus Dojkabacteria bacterium]
MKFFEQVYEIVKNIPEGKVSTYGQIASMLGNPRLARQVGFALRRLSTNEKDIPWWRVVNRDGYISINHGDGGIEKAIQAEMLKTDEVTFVEKYRVDLEHCLWICQKTA